MRNIIIAFIVGLVTSSCSQSFSELNQYYKFIDDSSNGLIKSKTINGFDLTVKYLPPELVVLEDEKHFGKEEDLGRAIANARYKKVFWFIIKPGLQRQKEDIVLYNVKSEDDFADRKRLLDFRFGSFFKLRCGDEEIQPQLFYTQTGQGVSSSIMVKLVFVSENKHSSLAQPCDFELFFQDPMFGTGVNVFSFSNDDVKRVPVLRK